jgi:hypothetical protein
MDPYTLLKIAIVVFIFALPILLVYLLIKSNKDN